MRKNGASRWTWESRYRLRKHPRDDDAVLQCVARSRRRLRAVGQHRTTARGVAGKVHGHSEQLLAARQVDVVALAEEAGVAEDQLGRQHPLPQQLAGAVEVGEDQVEQLGALDNAELDAGPFVARAAPGRGRRPRGPQPELVRPRDRLAVYVVGDAVVVEQAPRLGTDGGDSSSRPSLPMTCAACAQCSRIRPSGGEHLVVHARQLTVRNKEVARGCDRHEVTCFPSFPLQFAGGRWRSPCTGHAAGPESEGTPGCQHLKPPASGTGRNERCQHRRARRCATGGKPAGASGLGLVGVDRETVVGPPARVADVVGAAAERPPVPAVDEIEHEGGVDPDGRVQGRRRLPGPVAHAGDVSSRRSGRCAAGRARRCRSRRGASAVSPSTLDLEPLDRRVDVARGAVERHLFAQDVPRLDGRAQLEGHAVELDRAEAGEAELEERGQPGPLEAEAVPGEVGHHLADVGGHVPRQEEPVVQLACPSGPAGRRRGRPRSGRRGRGPAGPARGHPRVGRHLEAPQLEEPEAAPFRVGLNSLSMQNSARWVLPVTSTSRWRNRRSTSQGGARPPWPARQPLELGEGDLELVEALVARLVDPRGLAGGSDEPALRTGRKATGGAASR